MAGPQGLGHVSDNQLAVPTGALRQTPAASCGLGEHRCCWRRIAACPGRATGVLLLRRPVPARRGVAVGMFDIGKLSEVRAARFGILICRCECATQRILSNFRNAAQVGSFQMARRSAILAYRTATELTTVASGYMPAFTIYSGVPIVTFTAGPSPYRDVAFSRSIRRSAKKRTRWVGHAASSISLSARSNGSVRTVFALAIAPRAESISDRTMATACRPRSEPRRSK